MQPDKYQSALRFSFYELLLFPITSTLLKLTVEYLASRKFHKWTNCTITELMGVIQSLTNICRGSLEAQVLYSTDLWTWK